MRWLLVLFGLGLQIFAIAMYIAARRFLCSLSSDKLAGLEQKSLLSTPFIYLSASSLAWGIGILLISVFAVIDYDPVLLFSQGILLIIGSLVLMRFRMF